MIPLNKPFLPDQERFNRYIDEIWHRNHLTNHGPLVKQFEERVSEYLGIDNRMVFVNNGTTALQIAIKALDLTGEIITTPYSYVATTNAILWTNCKPVFSDIEKYSLNIDPNLIESAITNNTQAILATHVYGNPCHVEVIQELAIKYGLKVIYDAAHCFGVRYNGESIFNWGDISITSFHATKVFHTIEGGGLFSSDQNVINRIRSLMNFGHDGPYSFIEAGINGKNSEFHAAMGLCNLDYADQILEKRKNLVQCYDKFLNNVPVRRQTIREGTRYNYCYFPVLFNSCSDLISAQNMLNQNRIETRRYFRPSLDLLPYVPPFNCPIAQSVSSRVLCLPLYFGLTENEVEFICDVLKRSF